MAATLGRIDAFNPQTTEWDSYELTLTCYIKINKVDDGDRVPLLLTVVGTDIVQVLRDLSVPKELITLSFNEIIELLRSHFKRKTTKMASRVRFGNLRQSETQSIDQFEAALRKESVDCKFGDQLNDHLKDQFVRGVRSDAVRKKLLDMEDANFTDILKRARELEILDRDIKTLNEHVPSGAESTAHSTFNRTESSTGKSGNRPVPNSYSAAGYGLASRVQPPHTPCPRCGKMGHWASECFFNNAKCNKCHEIGHKAIVCDKWHRRQQNRSSVPNNFEDGVQSSGNKRQPDFKNKHFNTKAKTTDNDGDLSDSEHEETLNAINGPDPVFMSLEINNVLVRLEVDTGSRDTIIPKSVWTRIGSPSLHKTGHIIAYGQSKVSALGRCNVQVSCRNQEATLPLVVSDLKSETSLLGRTWIDTFKLVQYESSVLHRIATPGLESLLREYADLFAESLEGIKGVKATLHVRPGSTFKQFRARAVPFALQPKLDAELHRLESFGIIEKVDIAPKGTTPVVPILKPNGTLRVCGDSKVSVNQIIDPQQYPMPRTDELLQSMAHGERYSKIDLSDAYLQVEVDDVSKQYLVITTTRGLYRYNRLPFGVSAAPAIFQSVMDQIIQGLQATRAYLDDVAVTGRNDSEHLTNLRALFERFRKYGVRLKRPKCEFMADSMVYLGHQVTRFGTQPVESKCEAIARMPSPTNLNKLESFLGMVQFYSAYIPNLSSTAGPLNALRRKGTLWKWTPRCEQAFQTLKLDLQSRNVLAYFDENVEVGLATDASEYGIGAVLFHIYPNGTERPIQYASKTLNSAERNYAQIEKEALALIYGVKKFQKFLFGRRFTLRTDHKPLIKIFGPHSETSGTALGRLQRWALYLGSFDYEIEHRPGSENAAADGLSRLPLPDETPTLDSSVFKLHEEILQSVPVQSEEIARFTAHDPQISHVYRYIQDGWPEISKPGEREMLKPYFDRQAELTTQNGCILWGLRVVIPPGLRGRILAQLHETHTGIVKTKAVARGRVWWPSIDKDIEETCKSCSSCAEIAKDPAAAPLHSWEYPEKPWTRLHIDFAGPFLGHMWLVYVDAHSKYSGVIRMKHTGATETIDKLINLFAQFGLPKQIVSDNGVQFTSGDFDVFCKRYGIQHIRSAPYHPATNGEAERFVQTFKHGMKAMSDDPRPLTQKLQLFLLGYRTAPHSTTGKPPAELLFGRNIRAPIDLVLPDPRRKPLQAQDAQQKAHDVATRSREFNEGDLVFARWYHGPAKWRAGEIIKQTGPLSFQVQVGNELVHKHVDQLLERHSDPPSRTFNEELTAENQAAIDEFERHGAKTLTNQQQLQNHSEMQNSVQPAFEAEPPNIVEPSLEPSTPKVAPKVQAPTIDAPGVLKPKLRPRRDLKPRTRFDEEFAGLGSKKS